jgi:transcriptional regulator GlxA family with amidase domain
MQQLLADMTRRTEVGLAAHSGSGWMREAMRLIDSTITEEIDWEQIAESLGVSAVTLRRRFRDHLGFSPVTYRNRRLIGKACALMQQTDLSDQEIADALGFCDPQYFSRCFKRVIGSSPRSYRARLP